MDLPDVPAEYYLCWSSILIGISVPFLLVIVGLLRKSRRLVSLGIVAASVFVFYMSYWFWFSLSIDDPDYSTVPSYAWVLLGGIVVFGMALLVIGILLLLRKTATGTRLVEWLFYPMQRH
jgi:hypothetical protein